MSPIRKLQDYYLAVNDAREQSGKTLIGAIFDVFQARRQYKFGPKYYSMFQFHSRSRSAWCEYVLDTETNPKIRALNGGDLRLARNKDQFTKHCNDNDIPTIPILAIFSRKDFGRSGFPIIRSEEALSEFLSELTSHNRLFFKVLDGAHGKGAFSLDRVDGDWFFREERYGPSQLYKRLTSTLSDSDEQVWLIQPTIVSHRDLLPVMPSGSVGTIRAITVGAGSEIEILLPVLRIPRKGNSTDNFSEGTTGNLVAEINIETGSLVRAFGPKQKGWFSICEYQMHPDTGCTLPGFSIPYWDQAVELIKHAHASTPQFVVMGWDIGITDEGPVVVEVNTAFGPNLLQIAYQRGVRKDFQKFLK